MTDSRAQSCLSRLADRAAHCTWSRDHIPSDFIQSCRRNHCASPALIRRLWQPLTLESLPDPPADTGAPHRQATCRNPIFPVPSLRLRDGVAQLRAILSGQGVTPARYLDRLIGEDRLHFGADVARCEHRVDGPRVFLPSPTPTAEFWLTFGHEVGHALHFMARRDAGMSGPVAPLASEKHALRLEWLVAARLAERPGWRAGLKDCLRHRRRVLTRGRWRLHRFECTLYWMSSLDARRVNKLWLAVAGANVGLPAHSDAWVHWLPFCTEPFYSWVYPVAYRQCAYGRRRERASGA